MYDGARVKVLGNGAGTLRGLIVSGGEPVFCNIGLYDANPIQDLFRLNC